MTHNSDKIRILRVWCFCLLLIFELIQQAALVNFMLFLNKSHVFEQCGEKLHIP